MCNVEGCLTSVLVVATCDLEDADLGWMYLQHFGQDGDPEFPELVFLLPILHVHSPFWTL